MAEADERRQAADGGRRTARVVLLALALAAAALLALYQAFLARLPRPVDPRGLGRLDGIVVLTGGPGRVRHAVALLAAGHAPRLLVTGVDPRVADETFRSVFALSESLLSCCVVLDRKARNTLENAQSAVAWACAGGMRRIGVVSSAWHLPRAMLEFGRAARAAGLELALVPIPVPDAADTAPALQRMREAVKFALAALRARLVDRSAPAAPCGHSGAWHAHGEGEST